jgi:hypothetical protein
LVWGDSLADDPAANVWVLPGLSFVGLDTCECNCASEPLADFLDRRGVLLDEPTRRPKRARKDSDEEEIDDRPINKRYPWLHRYMGDEGEGSEGEIDVAKLDQADLAYSSDEEHEILTDEAREAAFAALEAKRMEMDAIASKPADHFKTQLLGGAWTALHSGVAFDNVKGYPSGKAATLWLQSYFGVRQITFALKKFGDEIAAFLALQWCRRMEYFYLIYTTSGSTDFKYTYTGPEIAAAPMCSTSISKALLVGITPQQRARVAELDSLVPMRLMGSSKASSSAG